MTTNTAASRGLRRSLGAAGAILLVLLPLACSGDDGGDDADGKATTTAVESVDACEVITDADVKEFLPGVDKGVATDNFGGGICAWRDPETEENVTVTIGAAGTGKDGLGEVSPYGETEDVTEVEAPARYAPSLGIIEFVADDRFVEIQVAVLDIDLARKGAVALAKQVQERL